MAVEYSKKSCGNDLEFIDVLINNMIEVLIEYASDDFWKLLKYGTRDALTNPSYTVSVEDKVLLSMQNYSNPTGEYIKENRIKNSAFNDDISAEEHNEVRIYDNGWTVSTDGIYRIIIGFDVICASGIVNLDTNEDYPVRKNAINVLQHELLSIFNNAMVSKNIGEFIIFGQRGVIRRFNTGYSGITFTLSGVSG